MVSKLRIRSVFRQINVLNLLLLVIIAVFAAYILPPLLNMKVTFVPPAPKKIAEESKEEKAPAAQSPSPAEYTIIAEQNVFNPERKIPAEKKDEKPLPKPEFVVYGTLITGDMSMAFLDDLKATATSPGRGKRQKVLRVGNTLSGYTLREVRPDSIVMVRGEDRMELRVIDSSKAKAREGGGPPSTAAAAGAQKPAAGSGTVSAQQGAAAPAIPRVSRTSQRMQSLQRRQAAQGQQNVQGQQGASSPHANNPQQ